MRDAATSTDVLEVLADEFNARPAALLVLAGRELASAMAKFKPFNSGHEGWAVIREELDELWEHVKANDTEGGEAFREAIQVAAMALRFAHDLSSLSAWEVASDGLIGEPTSAAASTEFEPRKMRVDCSDDALTTCPTNEGTP